MLSTSLSPTDTLIPRRISTTRRHILLIIFSLAQFLDAFNNSSVFPAIPTLIRSFGITESESTWVVSAFQLTLASFLLVSGRISDVYNAKAVLITGFFLFGIISISTVFSKDKITLIVLRGLVGIATSLIIPSALTLLVNVFTEPLEQARAIGIFVGCGAMGDVFGIVIGAVFVQSASWHWIFWFLALVTIPIALVCTIFVPPEAEAPKSLYQSASKFQSLDLVGVSLLTVTLVLLICALTFGPSEGWGSPLVIVLFTFSICLAGCFFYWETLLPVEKAVVPPRTWFYPNFTILFVVALMPFLWWTAVFMVFTTLWQDVYHWTAISSAVHILPNGISAFVTSWSGFLSRKFDPKWIIITGELLLMTATLLFVFADGPDKYWSLVFPAFLIGSTGGMLIHTHAGIAIFQTTPSSMAGTTGALFNSALQLGSAVGLAAVTSIETSVERSHGGFYEYHGRVAVFLFLLGVLAVQTTGILVFYRGRHQAVVSKSEGTAESSEIR